MNLPDLKRAAASEMLDRGSCFVHLDPRRAGVVVPSQFRDRETLTLQFAYGLPRPIFGLECDHDGIRGSLSFGGVYVACDIPWHAVHALTDDTGRGIRFAPQPTPSTRPRLVLLRGEGVCSPMRDAAARVRRRAFRVIEGGNTGRVAPSGDVA